MANAEPGVHREDPPQHPVFGHRLEVPESRREPALQAHQRLSSGPVRGSRRSPWSQEPTQPGERYSTRDATTRQNRSERLRLVLNRAPNGNDRQETTSNSLFCPRTPTSPRTAGPDRSSGWHPSGRDERLLFFARPKLNAGCAKEGTMLLVGITVRRLVDRRGLSAGCQPCHPGLPIDVHGRRRTWLGVWRCGEQALLPSRVRPPRSPLGLRLSLGHAEVCDCCRTGFRPASRWLSQHTDRACDRGGRHWRRRGQQTLMRKAQ